MNNILFKIESKENKKKKLKSNYLIENQTFIMKMTKSMKYNSALEDVEENSSKNDEFREICSFHRIVKIYIKNFKRLDLKN